MAPNLVELKAEKWAALMVVSLVSKRAEMKGIQKADQMAERKVERKGLQLVEMMAQRKVEKMVGWKVGPKAEKTAGQTAAKWEYLKVA